MTLTANIVTMSVFGAIVMYIISMLALFQLRKSEPLRTSVQGAALPDPAGHRARPGWLSLVAMIYYNTLLAAIFRRTVRAQPLAYFLADRPSPRRRRATNC